MSGLFNDPLRVHYIDDDEGEPLGRVEVYVSLYCAVKESGEKFKFDDYDDAVAWLMGEL